MKKSCAFMVCAIFVSLSGGCISPNSPTPRFYALSAAENGQTGRKFNISQGIIIVIGPVKIPEYLNRPQMVTQDKDKMLNFAQFDRWGESLDVSLERLISEDLTAMLPEATIEMFPWNLNIPVKYQVLISVIQLDSELEKDLFFVVQWSVIDMKDRKLLLVKRTEFRQPIEPHSYSGLAKTLSSACASLSIQIAGALSSLASPPALTALN